MSHTTIPPVCIGVIIDGNRRFAKERGISKQEGHRLGFEKVKELVQWCRDACVSTLIVYGFSSENWNRAPDEVSYLTSLFKQKLLVEAEILRGERGALRFIGDIDRFGEDFARLARDVEAGNPADPVITIVVALSYGGRPEIMHAVNALVKEDNGEVTQENFEQHLWTAGLPDPDLIIRAGGEKRLSNFLTWQNVYSELFFSDTMWPMFTREEFDAILAEYAKRERRMGK